MYKTRLIMDGASEHDTLAVVNCDTQRDLDGLVELIKIANDGRYNMALHYQGADGAVYQINEHGNWKPCKLSGNSL